MREYSISPYSMHSVLISGASTGIGEACAKYLAARGWQVFAGVRRLKDAQRLKAESRFIYPVRLDVTKPGEISKAIDVVGLKIGKKGLQGLVNNAGISIAGPLEYLSTADLRRQMEVNFIGAAALTQAFLPELRIGRGRVVNISSIGGRATSPFNVPYSASKHALEAFTDGLRRELLPWKIHVASVEPGAIDTAIWNKALKHADATRARFPRRAESLYGQAMERARRRAVLAGERGLPPEEVAHVVYHALGARRPRTRYVVGRRTKVAIWLTHLLPDEWVDWAIGRALYR